MRHEFRSKRIRQPTGILEMKKLTSCAMRAALLWMAGALVPTAGASPITFTITGGSWTLGGGWGPACTTDTCDASHTALNADWTIDASLAQSFTLGAVGDTRTVTFGAATLAEEDNKIDAGEQNNLGVTGILNLSAPLLFGESNLAVVIATTGSTNDAAVDLSVGFAPVSVSFGVGGEFTVDLSDSTWDCNGHKLCQWENPDTRTITALFTLTKLPTTGDPPLVPEPPGPGDPASVPEPVTLALLGVSLAGLG